MQPRGTESRRAWRRRALVFALTSVPLLVVMVLAYPWVLPPWERAVVAASDALLRTGSPGMTLAIDDSGWWRAHVLAPDGTPTFFWGRPPENLHLFFLGLALLPALLLATPVPLARRAALVAAGLVLLFASHVGAACALVHAQHHLRMVDAGSVFWDWVKTNANAFGQVVSFALWALLTWPAWLRPTPAPEREAGP